MHQVHVLLRRFRRDNAPVENAEDLEEVALLGQIFVQAVRIVGGKVAGSDVLETLSTVDESEPHWIYSRWAMLPASTFDSAVEDWNEAEEKGEKERLRSRLAQGQEKSLSEARARAELETLVSETEDRAFYLELSRLTTLAVRRCAAFGFHFSFLKSTYIECFPGVVKDK